jgi:hypothetical protein
VITDGQNNSIIIFESEKVLLNFLARASICLESSLVFLKYVNVVDLEYFQFCLITPHGTKVRGNPQKESR